jgi:hypothetical protein
MIGLRSEKDLNQIKSNQIKALVALSLAYLIIHYGGTDTYQWGFKVAIEPGPAVTM